MGKLGLIWKLQAYSPLGISFKIKYACLNFIKILT